MADVIRSVLLAIEVESDKSKKDIDALEKSIEELNKTTAKTEEQNRELAKQEKELGKLRKQSGSALSSLTKSMAGYVKSLGIAALAAGALAAIGKGLVESLKTNKNAMDALAVESAALGGAMDALKADVGITLAEFLGLIEAVGDSADQMTFTEKALSGLSSFLNAVGIPALGAYAKALEGAAKQAANVERFQIALRDSTSAYELQVGELNLKYQEQISSIRELDRTGEQNIQTLKNAKVTFDEISRTQENRLKVEVALAKGQLAAAAGGVQEQAAQDNLNRTLLKQATVMREIETRRVELLGLQKEAIDKHNAETKAIQDQNAALQKNSEAYGAVTRAKDEDIQVGKEVELQGAQGAERLGQILTATQKQEAQAEEDRKNNAKANSLRQERQVGEAMAGLDAATNISGALRGLNIDNAALNKGLAISDTIINTARGVMATIGQTGFFGLPLALIVSALGAAQLSIIASQEFAHGGRISGPSHARGGVNINAEGGEAVINKRSMANPVLRSIASDINVAGGGKRFALGGMVGSTTPSLDNSFTVLGENLERAIKNAPPVLVTEDLNFVQNRVDVIEDRARI